MFCKKRYPVSELAVGQAGTHLKEINEGTMLKQFVVENNVEVYSEEMRKLIQNCT